MARGAWSGLTLTLLLVGSSASAVTVIYKDLADDVASGTVIQHVCFWGPCGSDHQTLMRRPVGGSWAVIADWLPNGYRYEDTEIEHNGVGYEYLSFDRVRLPPWYLTASNLLVEDLECFEQDSSWIGGLTTVQVGCNRDGNPACTGADIEDALDDCDTLDGCILQLEPQTYTDVAINIGDKDRGWGPPHNCQPEHTSCFFETFDLPDGLVIQGHGSATVLQSPVWASGYFAPYPILRFYSRPDIQLRVRDLVLDGRKAEQGDPGADPQNPTPTSKWHHVGLSQHNWSAALPRNTNSCVHDVTVENLLSRGISVGDANGFIVEYSTVRDIGCYANLTSCPALTNTPDVTDFDTGYQAEGYGIAISGDTDRAIVRFNETRRTAKYGIEMQSGGGAVLTNPWFVENDIYEAGHIGLFVSDVADGLIEHNRVHGTVQPGLTRGGILGGSGISLPRVLERTKISNNVFSNLAHMAVYYDSIGDGNVLEDNVFDGICQNPWLNPGGVNGNPGTKNPAVLIHTGSTGGTVEFRSNRVSNNLCMGAFGQTFSNAGADVDILIDGGSYAGGPSYGSIIGYGARFHGLDVTLKGEVSFTSTDTCLQFRDNVASPPESSHGVIHRHVDLSGCGTEFTTSGGSTVVDCRADPAQLECLDPDELLP